MPWVSRASLRGQHARALARRRLSRRGGNVSWLSGDRRKCGLCWIGFPPGEWDSRRGLADELSGGEAHREESWRRESCLRNGLRRKEGGRHQGNQHGSWRGESGRTT